MGNIKVYSTPTCPWCHKVKAYLTGKKLQFDDLNVATDAKARDDMVEKSGQMGVPVLEINGDIIIGFDQPAIDAALKKKIR
jgi:glutaredoxin 3